MSYQTRRAPASTPVCHCSTPCRRRAEILRQRADAHASQIQPVRVPARLHGHMRFEVAVAVTGARIHQELHFGSRGIVQHAMQPLRESRVLRLPACFVRGGVIGRNRQSGTVPLKRSSTHPSGYA